MKEIKLIFHDHFKCDDGYEINLGNGTSHRFSSKRQATDFLSQTNKFLTQSLFSLNTLYTDLFVQFRQVYILSESFKFDRDQMLNFETAQHRISNAFRRCHGRSASYFVFFDLLKACEVLHTITTSLLNNQLIKRYSTIARHTLSEVLDRLNAFHVRLLNYGQAGAFKIFRITDKEIQSYESKMQVA